MKVLLTNAEGFQLSETSRVIYSPGYESANLQKSEHECLCLINGLVESRLLQEGHEVVSRKYDHSKHAEYMFDKARQSKGCDVAIMLALNNSQNINAQFSTAMFHSSQDNNCRKLFEASMYCLGRFMPIQSRYPNSSRRIPYLETCKRNFVPAVIILPFFITDKKLNDDKLGKYIQSAATAISETILTFRPEQTEGIDVTEF